MSMQTFLHLAWSQILSQEERNELFIEITMIFFCKKQNYYREENIISSMVGWTIFDVDLYFLQKARDDGKMHGKLLRRYTDLKHSLSHCA